VKNMGYVNPADVRSEQTREQKARWVKGFPASHTFGESRYTVAREGNEWYAYCNRLGVFFVSTTPQTVFDAIRSDMNDNNVTGALIHVKTGTISPVAITLDRDNTILQGEGWQTFLDSTAGAPAVTITGDGCIVRDLAVRTATGLANSILVTGGNARIERVWFWSSTADALHIDGTMCTVNKCLMAEIGANGIHVDGTYAKIYDNEITAINIDGIRLDGNYGIVSDNHILGCTFDGIRISSTGNLVDNNTIYGIGDTFISIESSQNIVRGNFCFDAGEIGIHIAHRYNIVANNIINRTDDSAIVIASGRNNNIIKGNSIMAMWGVNAYGILVSPCSGAVIGDNIIQSVSSGYGIRVLHPASGVVINCNRIDRSATSGLWISGYSHAVTGNIIGSSLVDNSVGSAVANNVIM